MIGVGVVIVWSVVRTFRVAVGVPEVRGFQCEVAVTVDAQHHPVRGAEATAREDGEAEQEDGGGAKRHR